MKMLLGIVLLSVLPLTLWAKSQCCEGYGCFTDDPPFDDLPLPDCPVDIELSQRVYTQSNPQDGQVLTTTTIPPVYDSSRKTIWIVHGWYSSRDSEWIHRMKDAFLGVGDFNVIITGWSGSAQQLWYPTSASTTRVVGAVIGRTAQLLVDQTGATGRDFWCIGHSLGAHACGHAGNNAHFGRVTGLDPAGPYFEDKDLSIGLNPSTADFVDVVHTNGEGSLGLINLGTMRPLGHVDFYPNGGGSQPECILDPINNIDLPNMNVTEILPLIDFTMACSHSRVSELFIESLTNKDCMFYSRFVCTDQHDIPGSCLFCGDQCQVMGWQADQNKQQGLVYLETDGREPYCLG